MRIIAYKSGLIAKLQVATTSRPPQNKIHKIGLIADRNYIMKIFVNLTLKLCFTEGRYSRIFHAQDLEQSVWGRNLILENNTAK